jgi:hypothetical protein
LPYFESGFGLLIPEPVEKASGFFLEIDMAKQNNTKFLKRQKEFDRMKKAREKMDRRHCKIDKEKEETVPTETFDPSEQA